MAQPTSDRTGAPTGTGGRGVGRSTSPLRRAAGAVGTTFLVVGILGFVPGITQNLSDIEWIGHESEAELLGLFQVNVLHNLVHLAFGLLGLWAATRDASVARAYLLGGGAVYLVLWLYGLLIDLDSDANFVSLNTADNWLHFGLGVGMVALGLALGRRAGDARAAR